MNITQIRNATQHITFGGKTFLIDPMLADKGTYCSAAIFFAQKRDKFCTVGRCQKDTFCTVQK